MPVRCDELRARVTGGASGIGGVTAEPAAAVAHVAVSSGGRSGNGAASSVGSGMHRLRLRHED